MIMQHSAITFRRATSDDYQAVEDLAIDLMHELPINYKDEAFSRKHMESIASTGRLDVFVACDGDEIVGTLGFILGPEPWSGRVVAYEAFWYVKPSHRRGVGMKLLKYVEKNIDCAIIDLGVYNPKLLKLLERNGYTAAKTVVTKEL